MLAIKILLSYRSLVNIELLQYSICNLKYSISKVTTLRFNNVSNYDYNCTIKEEFERQFKSSRKRSLKDC